MKGRSTEYQTNAKEQHFDNEILGRFKWFYLIWKAQWLYSVEPLMNYEGVNCVFLYGKTTSHVKFYCQNARFY